MSSNDENKVNNAKVLNSKENAELNCKLRWLGIGFQDFWNICVCENCVVWAKLCCWVKLSVNCVVAGCFL